MLIPLRQWFCDTCGDIIASREDGYVIWRTDAEHLAYDFKIIHKARCDQNNHSSSADVHAFLGKDGLTYLLTWLSIGPIKLSLGESTEPEVKDIDKFVDFIRRMQTPYYEDARKHFGNEEIRYEFSDANEFTPYRLDALRRIASRSE